jgi:dTDP-D-glucose 4,6-dehydratase
MLARNGQPIPIHGDGMATRSYMHVHDAASAFDTILHKVRRRKFTSGRLLQLHIHLLLLLVRHLMSLVPRLL